MPVPCESALTHGGRPPSKANSDSQATPPASGHGERDGLVEQAPQALVVLGVPVPVGLAERPEPLHLQALAGIELPHQAARAEAHALAVAQERPSRPPHPVALEREEGERRALGGQQPAGGQRAHVREHGAELAPALAAEAAERPRRAVVDGAPHRVARRIQAPGRQEPVEGRADRGRGAGPGRTGQEANRRAGDAASARARGRAAPASGPPARGRARGRRPRAASGRRRRSRRDEDREHRGQDRDRGAKHRSHARRPRRRPRREQAILLVRTPARRRWHPRAGRRSDASSEPRAPVCPAAATLSRP